MSTDRLSSHNEGDLEAKSNARKRMLNRLENGPFSREVTAPLVEHLTNLDFESGDELDDTLQSKFDRVEGWLKQADRLQADPEAHSDAIAKLYSEVIVDGEVRLEKVTDFLNYCRKQQQELINKQGSEARRALADSIGGSEAYERFRAGGGGGSGARFTLLDEDLGSAAPSTSSRSSRSSEPSTAAYVRTESGPDYRSTEAILAVIDAGPVEYPSYDDLTDLEPARLPDDFMGRSSTYRILEIKYMKNGGEAVYYAINTCSKLRNIIGNQTAVDNENMLIEMHGRLFDRKNEITFDELAEATFGMSAYAILREYNSLKGKQEREGLSDAEAKKISMYKQFLDAARTILTKMEQLEVDEENTERKAQEDYRASRERIEFEGDAKKQAAMTAQFFDRNEYAPVSSRSLWDTVAYGAEGRHELSYDTWQRHEAHPLFTGYRYRNRGENELVSQAYLARQLESMPSREAYIAKMNKWRILGIAHYQALAELNLVRPNWRKYKEDDEEIEKAEAIRRFLDDKAPELQAADLDNEEFKPSALLVTLIRQGAMLEAEAQMNGAQAVVEQNTDTPESFDASPDRSAAIDSIIEQMRADGLLSEEELATLQDEGSSYFFFAMVAAAEFMRNPANGDFTLEDLQLALGGGFQIDENWAVDIQVVESFKAPESSEREFSFIPRIKNLSTGVTYETQRKDEGFMRLVRTRSFARGIKVPGEEGVQLSVGGSLLVDLGENSAWAANTGLRVNKTTKMLTWEIGVERDMQRAVENAYQRFLQRKKRTKGGERSAIANAEWAAHNTIQEATEAGTISPEERAALQIASYKYLEGQMRDQFVRRYAKWWKPRFAGAGVMVSTDLVQGGRSFGPFAKFAFAGRNAASISPDEPTTQVLTGERETYGGEVSYRPSESVVYDETGAIRYLNETQREAAEAEAQASAAEIVASVSDALGKNIELVQDDDYVILNLKSTPDFPIDGLVNFDVDPSSGIEVVLLDDNRIALNLDRKDPTLRMEMRRIAKGSGDATEVHIFLGGNEAYNSDQQYERITWIQSYDGSPILEPEIRAVDGSQQAIFTQAEMQEQEIRLGDLSRNGSKQSVVELNAALFDLYDRQGKLRDEREAKLYQGEDEAKNDPVDLLANSTKIENIAKDVAANTDFDRLVSGNTSEREALNTLIKVELKKNYLPETLDLVFEVRQRATRLKRIQHTEMPLDWNEAAYRELFADSDPAAAQLGIDYMTTKASGIFDGSEEGAVRIPYGATFSTYVAVGRDMRQTQEHYDPEIDGSFSGVIRWGTDNASISDTLRYLDLTDDADNRAKITATVEAIKSALPDESGFETPPTDFSSAVDTVIGELLISQGPQLFGAADFAILLEALQTRQQPTSTIIDAMPAGPDRDKALRQKELTESFLLAVQELMVNQTTTAINGIDMRLGSGGEDIYEYYTAFRDDCKNLTVARSLHLQYARVEGGSSMSIESFVQSQTELTRTRLTPQYTTIKVPLGGVPFGPPLVPEGNPDLPAQAGSDAQATSPITNIVEDRLGSGSSVLNEEDEDNGSF